jgi:hypothetical protein
MKKSRLNVYLKPGTFDAIKAVSEKLGMSETGLASLSIELGMQALRMSMDPEFQKLFQEVNKDDLATDRGSSSKQS